MKACIRDTVTLIFIAATFPLWGPVRVFGLGGREIGLFVTFGQSLSLIPGTLGVWLRRAYYVMTLGDCAWDVGIGFGTWFSKRNVAIEPRVSIGAHCTVGICGIGRGTLLGSNIDVLSGRHQHGSTDSMTARRAQLAVFTRVEIGRNVWIGNRAVIMADIGDDCVIGAAAVVVRPIPPATMAAGNPAVVKKSLVKEAPLSRPKGVLP